MAHPPPSHPAARRIVRRMMERCRETGYELTGPLVANPRLDPFPGIILRIYDPDRDAGCRIVVSDEGDVVVERCEVRGGEPLADDRTFEDLVACALER